MKPGVSFVRSWLPASKSKEELSETLTIYDAGDIQGFLIQSSIGNTIWIVFQIESRVTQDDGTVLETGQIIPESLAPLHFFAITQYPLKRVWLEQSQYLFSLPQAEILLTFSPPLLPVQLPSRPQVHMPSLPHLKARAGPESRGSPKSNSRKPVDVQLPSRNIHKVSPRPTASPSSNPNRPAQPLLPSPKKQEELPRLSSPTDHTDRESAEYPPWTSLVLLSPYSRPPPELEGELAEQA